MESPLPTQLGDVSRRSIREEVAAPDCFSQVLHAAQIWDGVERRVRRSPQDAFAANGGAKHDDGHDSAEVRNGTHHLTDETFLSVANGRVGDGHTGRGARTVPSLS